MSIIGTRRGYRRRGGRYYGRDRDYRSSRRWGGERSWGARRRVGSTGGVEMLARAGLVARGVVYVVVGVIAVMMALGIGRHTPDRRGALEAIAAHPLGYVLLWLLVIAFAGLAIWRLVQAATPGVHVSAGQRLFRLGVGIAYAIVFFSTLWFVRDGRTPPSSDAAPRDVSAEVLSWNGGYVLLTVAGIIIAAAGVVSALRGFRAEFVDDLRMGWMPASTQDAVVALGRFGYVARGVIVAGIGIALVDAAVTYDPDAAKGLDGVLAGFAHTFLGPWLLLAVALGLIAFGILSFFEAKWRRTYGGVPV
ncbi:DUF1206 domain-containing protein [Nocardia aurantia]|uniref:DUF1206 domain-containing protein n=1 Tax=Nocardia aurantia TaxID=2585199 RepID=A0A7K0DVR8_9NOCA|nr:DUF1206 domain-containing protein [Nocardia aurantia]MQY29825.1 hypothetical protein [Nocardia aurantia]